MGVHILSVTGATTAAAAIATTSKIIIILSLLLVALKWQSGANLFCGLPLFLRSLNFNVQS